jgi:pimeloyl-ACP methyl ester carboxylesterase
MPELKLKEVSLNYEVDDFTDPWLKNKETVLLHHGCGRNLKMWYRWVPILSRKYRVIRVDARGFGKSSDPGPDCPFSIEVLARDVIALIDYLEIPQIYYVGEGGGGYTGYQLAVDYPERIKKLVLSNSPHCWMAVKPWQDRIDSVGLKGYVGDGLAERIGGTKAYQQWFAEEYARSRPHIAKAAMQAISKLDFRDRLSNIKSPILSIWGEASHQKWDSDGMIAALMMEKLPKLSDIVIIKGAPKSVFYARPEMTARLSMRFFKKKE